MPTTFRISDTSTGLVLAAVPHRSQMSRATAVLPGLSTPVDAGTGLSHRLQIIQSRWNGNTAENSAIVATPVRPMDSHQVDDLGHQAEQYPGQ